MFNKYILMNESGEVNTMQNNKRAFVLERFGCGSCVTEAKGIVILIVVSFLLRMKVYRRIIQYGISAILFAIALLFNLLVYIKFTLFFYKLYNRRRRCRLKSYQKYFERADF